MLYNNKIINVQLFTTDINNPEIPICIKSRSTV